MIISPKTTNMRSAKKARLLWLALFAGVGPMSPEARAIIDFGVSGGNTTTPQGNVGIYEGSFNGGFTGTPITSSIMATATHLTPGETSSFVFNNNAATATTYTVQLEATLDDLALWQIAPNQTANFSVVAPIYSGSGELNSTIVDVGRGYSRGGAVTGGWSWGGGQGAALSWGTNTISSIDTDTQLGTSGALGGDFLQYNFTNQNPSSPTYNPNECIVTPFDSGGGVFVNVGGQYQLAGVNSLVDGAVDSNGNSVSASLYNTNGYYDLSAVNGDPVLINNATPVSENSYATRISSKLNFVGLVDGTIPASAAAQYPINNDGLLAVDANMTLGAVTGKGSLQVGSTSATVKLQIAPGSGTSDVSGLTISGNSTLDITNNRIIIENGDNSMEETWLLKCLAKGYNGGLWNGPGIDSSTAAADPSLYGVGFADASDANVTGLTSGQVEIAFTLNGDCTLDGKVNGTDFAILASYFNQAAPQGWEDGDFTYSGHVNGTDFNLLVPNLDTGLGGAGTSPNWAALEAFAAANGLSQDVPEPSGASVLVLCGAAAWLLRRTRNPVAT